MWRFDPLCSVAGEGGCLAPDCFERNAVAVPIPLARSTPVSSIVISKRAIRIIYILLLTRVGRNGFLYYRHKRKNR